MGEVLLRDDCGLRDLAVGPHLQGSDEVMGTKPHVLRLVWIGNVVPDETQKHRVGCHSFSPSRTMLLRCYLYPSPGDLSVPISVLVEEHRTIGLAVSITRYTSSNPN